MTAKEVKLELANSDLEADLQKLKDELAITKQSEHCPQVSPGPQKSGAASGGCHRSHARVLMTNMRA